MTGTNQTGKTLLISWHIRYTTLLITTFSWVNGKGSSSLCQQFPACARLPAKYKGIGYVCLKLYFHKLKQSLQFNC